MELKRVVFVFSLLIVCTAASRLIPGQKFSQSSMASSRMKLTHILNSRGGANLTAIQRLDALQRMDRQKLALRHQNARFVTTDDASDSSLQYTSGVYTIQAAIGNPLQQATILADTGSDMLWYRCQGDQSSSTMTKLPCSDDLCRVVPSADCAADSNQACPFKYGYLGGDSLSGEMVYDQAVFNGFVVPRVAIGCATQVSSGLSGLMGLGRGPLSIITQAADTFDSTFSYCLEDFNQNQFGSYLNLGRDGTTGLTYTPIVETADYRVQIDSVRVGNRVVPMWEDVWNANGGTVFDSGTTMTYLQPAALEAIWNVYRSIVRLQPVGGFDNGACFDVSGLSQEQIEGSLPTLSFGFGGGVTFAPPFKNLFVTPQENVRCLGFLRAGDGWPTLFGNLLQQGFHMENDLKNNRIGFAYTQCRQSQ